MAFGKIEVDTRLFEKKLEMLYKHLGNYLEELESMCSSCGSTDTTKGEKELNGFHHVFKSCNNCGEMKQLDKSPTP